MPVPIPWCATAWASTYTWQSQWSNAERCTLEIACHILPNRTLDQVHQLNVEAFTAAGGDVVHDLPMICVRVLLAVEMALVDHEVKRALTSTVGPDIEAHHKLKQLGFVARDGQQSE